MAFGKMAATIAVAVISVEHEAQIRESQISRTQSVYRLRPEQGRRMVRKQRLAGTGKASPSVKACSI
jgi:hypothetical protein